MRSLLIVALAACSSSAPKPAPTTTPFTCDTPLDGAEALARPGRVALFGEIHGTAELPTLFGRAVCTAAATTDVLVGVEIPRTEQAAIDAFVASDGGAAARDALIAGAFWHGPWLDGRNSHAMVALLDRVRALRAAGADVRVVAFDIAPDAAGNRDEQMARALIDARAAAPDAALLVLTGNLHARLASGLPPLPDMVPMGSYVIAAAPDTISFDARYAGGTAWVCTGETPADCGVEAWGEGDDPGGTRLDAAPAAPVEGYTGTFHVGGPVSASLPAIQP